MNAIRKTLGRQFVSQTLVVVFAATLASGCATVNENANAIVLSTVLGAAGGVAGYAVARDGGATAGAAVGAGIGGFVGHQVDKLVKRKTIEKTRVRCPFCGDQTNVDGVRVGDQAHCQHCGGRFVLSERAVRR